MSYEIRTRRDALKMIAVGMGAGAAAAALARTADAMSLLPGNLPTKAVS